MKAGLALLLLIIGGFLLYEVVIGNGPAIISGLRGESGTGTGQAGGGGGDFGTPTTNTDTAHRGTTPGTVGRS